MTGAPAPTAIGTRGTVGSLVKKEIEYLTKFELDGRGSSQKPVDVVSCGGYCRTSFWVLLMTWNRKKRRCTSGFLPSICSVAEVAESNNQLSRIPGYSYRILKNDLNNFQP